MHHFKRDFPCDLISNHLALKNSLLKAQKAQSSVQKTQTEKTLCQGLGPCHPYTVGVSCLDTPYIYHVIYKPIDSIPTYT